MLAHYLFSDDLFTVMNHILNTKSASLTQLPLAGVVALVVFVVVVVVGEALP